MPAAREGLAIREGAVRRTLIDRKKEGQAGPEDCRETRDGREQENRSFRDFITEIAASLGRVPRCAVLRSDRCRTAIHCVQQPFRGGTRRRGRRVAACPGTMRAAWAWGILSITARWPNALSSSPPHSTAAGCSCRISQRSLHAWGASSGSAPGSVGYVTRMAALGFPVVLLLVGEVFRHTARMTAVSWIFASILIFYLHDWGFGRLMFVALGVSYLVMIPWYAREVKPCPARQSRNQRRREQSMTAQPPPPVERVPRRAGDLTEDHPPALDGRFQSSDRLERFPLRPAHGATDRGARLVGEGARNAGPCGESP